jgi:hypothetical protein
LRFTVVVLSALAALFLVPPSEVRAMQDDRARFEIVSPNDTSLSFPLGNARWVKTGMTGIVVDPSQRDALVATFRVSRLDERIAHVTVTGTTTGITVFHAALLVVPKRTWLKNKFFWIGSGVGLLVGFLAGRG